MTGRAGMTAEEEAVFIACWQEGLTAEEMAERFHIPRGTVSSRARLLRDKYGVDLPKRPNGGAYPALKGRQGGQGSPRGAPPDEPQVIPGLPPRDIPEEGHEGGQVDVLPPLPRGLSVFPSDALERLQ